MPDYVVYSTSNTHYQRWQCELLEYSFVSVAQPGKLVCLCSEGENGQLPMRESDIAEIVPLPSYMKNEETGDFWGIANKMLSLKAWIEDESIDGSILFLDPDMLFIEPIDLSTEEGKVIAQRWIDPGIEENVLFKQYCNKNAETMTRDNIFMYPYLMHSSDVRKTIDRYVEIAFQIREEEKKWESDMYALIIVAAEYGLEIETLDTLGVCNNWQGLNQEASNIVHFPGPFIADDGEKIWFKQDFTQKTLSLPWQDVPDPNLAASRAEYSALHLVKQLVNRQVLSHRGSGFLYWQSLAQSNCLADYKADSEKFIVFDQYPGGFNNIRMSLELAACFAFLLNRTLVLPPRTSFYLLDGECGFEDFFDISDIGIDTISFESYCQRINISTEGPLENIWDKIASKSTTIDWNIIEDVTVMPGADLSSPYAKRYIGTRKTHTFSKAMLSADALYFPKNLLGNYYLNIFADERLEDLSRYMARHIHYREGLFTEAYNIIEQLGDGNYAAIHVRRNDFQYKDLFISGEEIYKNIKEVLKEGEILYIATDAADTAFLAPLEAHYKVYYYKDLASQVNRYIDKNLVGCLEQLVCTRARVFIGNKLSTLSSYVYRLRGYMNDVHNENYYDNTTRCQLSIDLLDPPLEPALKPAWSDNLMASWAREFPEAWTYKNEKIFVSIAAYRDPDITNTIEDILNKADDVKQLILGVCLQESQDVLDAFPYKDHPNVRVILMHYKDTKGVSFARAKIQTDLYQNEKYFLQIDSHSRFSEGWDTYLKSALDSCKVAKPILSTYPNPFEQDDKIASYLKEKQSNGIVYKHFDKEGYLHVIGARTVDSTYPVPGLWIGAGFIFSYGRWIREVPYDPEIYFKGEEDSLHIRSFTYGWDVFIPPENAVFHDYNDNRLQSPTKVRPLHWEDHENPPGKLEKIKRLHNGEGLGPIRSIDDFETHFGVDFKLQTIQQWAKEGFPSTYYEEEITRKAMSVELDSDAIAAGDHLLWIFCLFDEYGEEVFRRDFNEAEILKGELKTIELYFEPRVYDLNLVKALIWPAFGKGDFAPRHEYEIDVNFKEGWIRPKKSRTLTLDLSHLENHTDLRGIIISFVDSKGKQIHQEVLDDPKLLQSPASHALNFETAALNASAYIVLPLLKDGSFLPGQQYAI